MKTIDITAVLTGAQLMVSMVETRRAARNGDGMEANAPQELEQIERQLGKLESLDGQSAEVRKEIDDLRERVSMLRQEMSHREAWIKTELARHPQRPYFLDYVEKIFTDFSEIHGDRRYADDPAMVCGMARFHGVEVLVLGTQKGRDMKQKVHRNFGLPNPEGYRKALRAMQIAEKFSRPIFTFVDVTGANPGLGAEERGQAEAIALNLREMARLRVPIITAITGEGGSGGALAIAVSDRVLMMENAVYSVISPEGCASIMWRDATKKELAAEALRITAPDLIELGCVDAIIDEPPGGAHTDPDLAAKLLDDALQKHFGEIEKLPAKQLVDSRYNKFRKMAQFYTEG
ncbi:MAG TPA: acetyl-CoA carboxylase carboxyltransferase subunit alpha [Terriglobales bacterium]|jgi:acetyl-CoA carboxylase carboxyl transferase subunit alpha|nr:acetyl-CoA carboxylase carboxyltransferase subunit alpha [Terriglobales bacterium]